MIPFTQKKTAPPPSKAKPGAVPFPGKIGHVVSTTEVCVRPGEPLGLLKTAMLGDALIGALAGMLAGKALNMAPATIPRDAAIGAAAVLAARAMSAPPGPLGGEEQRPGIPGTFPIAAQV